jgi:hypothetical protein
MMKILIFIHGYIYEITKKLQKETNSQCILFI